MMLLLAAAQSDPAAFDRPDTFDPGRESNRHSVFGQSAHFCLGAPLARLEAMLALSAVAARFCYARLTGKLTYRPHLTLRGVASQPVALTVPRNRHCLRRTSTFGRFIDAQWVSPRASVERVATQVIEGAVSLHGVVLAYIRPAGRSLARGLRFAGSPVVQTRTGLSVLT